MDQTDLPSSWPRRRWVRGLLLCAGLVAPQFVWFGASLLGLRLLLPLDLLALRNFYLPRTPEYAAVVPHDFTQSDQILAYRMDCELVAAELRAGRLPLWDPNAYAGAPFAAFPIYSPYHLLYAAWPSPYALAWIQLLKSLVAGAGTYWFLRRALGLSFWPAAVAAWGYPLTGVYALWQGHMLTFTTAWLPWLLAAVDAAVRRPLGPGGPLLAVVTALVVVSGHADVGGQVLLVSGLYALWCLADQYGRALLSPAALGGAGAAGLGWLLGLMLAAPYLLPLVEYARTGARMARRAGGVEERPPVGWPALPQVVIPEFYGSTRPGSVLLRGGNLLESAASAYAGLLATLVLAPLAWCSRRHRSANVFWLLLAVVGLGWTLNLPGLVAVLRLPVLRMFSHNRLVFATGFALVALAATGLEALREPPRRRAWFWLPTAVLAVLGGWCAFRAARLPAALANLPTARADFLTTYVAAAVGCGVGVMA